jgi:superfamily II DNA or RNA helicase
MYRAAIAARARLDTLVHGSLAALMDDYRAIARLFEMYVADRLSLQRGVPFLLWEHLPRAIKDARGMSHGDTGIDVTDGQSCAVQCKLRHGSLTWRECSTFFASALALREDPTVVQWSELLLARNACSTLSRDLAFLRSTRKDMPVALAEFRAYVAECIAAHPQATPAAPAALELRDYQLEAIDLCCDLTQGPAYIVLPTGTGKSIIIVSAAERILRDLTSSVLILAPYITIADQIEADLARRDILVDYVGDTRQRSPSARVAVCVYASAHLVDIASFTRIFIDEAHRVRNPGMYDEHEEPAPTDTEDGDEAASGHSAVRAAVTLPSACLLSATLDIPDGAPRVTCGLGEMIEADYLCDFELHIPVFDAEATDASLARHLVANYDSMIVFARTRDEGKAFAALLDACAANGAGIASFIDCYTPAAERRRIVASFRAGLLPFVVNVRVLSIGFDAPITKAVCFLHMPASSTHIVQVVGRALRLHPDKQIAAVVLPFVCAADHLAGAGRARDFMRVMAQADTRFALSLRRGGDGFVRVTRVHLTLGEAADDGAEVLCVEIYDSMCRAVRGLWETNLAAYVQYVADHGEPPKFNGPQEWLWLYTWMIKQRSTHDTMPAGRREALDAISFCWSQLDADFARGLAGYVRFVAAHGRIMPPRAGPDAWLHSWIASQRKMKHAMSETRRAALNAVGFVWDQREHKWDFMYTRLGQHMATHDGAKPAPHGPDADLYSWVQIQIQKHAIGTLRADREAKLEALEGWRWS